MSSEWSRRKVYELQASGSLLVEDGNHGENRPRPDEFSSEGASFIRAADMADGRVLFTSAGCINSVARARVRKGIGRPGDVLLSHKGTVGKVALVESNCPDFVCSPQTTFWRILDDSVIDRRYLFAYLQSHDFKVQLASRKGETDMADYVSLTAQRQLNVLLPHITVQRAIGDYSSMLADRIALLRETNATLEAIAQALFKSWFVDFDPVHARARGEEPAGLSPEVASMFPDSFEESELGLVPKGWKFGTLADLSDLNPESWTSRTHPESVLYVDLANTKDNVIAEVTEFTFEEAPSRARRVLRDGDTIIGTVRPGNRSFAFINQPSANLTGSTGFAVLRPQHERNTEFVFLAATSDNSIDYLAHVADGGAYPAVRPEVVSGLSCVVPDGDVLCAFHDVAQPIFNKVAANHEQAQTLATLRDVLLPRLISGQLRLPEALAHLGDTLA